MTWTCTYSATIAADRPAVFIALTEPAALRAWFAEQVDVGTAPGAPFRFWGRHSFDTPTASDATQTLTACSPNESLAFAWTIGGIPTHVTWHLHDVSAINNAGASDTHCRIDVQHVVSGPLPFPRERELIDDLWRLTFGNLATYLAGDGGMALPDFTDPSPVIRQRILIDAPRDVVFRALITPSLVNQWMGATAAVIEPRIGGRYELGWQYNIGGVDVIGGPTRILEMVENERLTLDWPDWRGDAAVTGQTISFQLTDVNGQTQVDFVHAGFLRATDLSDYPFGWSYFLGQLRAVALAA